MRKITLLFLISLLSLVNLYCQTPAFPGAEGGGMYATGGRGGRVLIVTSLADDGSTGTLRWAVNQTGPRIVVFRVAGTITLTSRLSISKGDLTIAGQTAPGDGICLRNYDVYVGANNVIIRFIRVRLGNAILTNESDAIWGRYQNTIILDHCSFSWSIDETASFYSNENFTMQWCFITESLNEAGHSKGAHGYGGIWGGKNASFHHNLIAYHNSRNPRFNGYLRSGLGYTNPLNDEVLDFRNNVLYGWGGNSSYGGESGKYNIVNNYFKYGPGTSSGVRYKITQVDIDADPTKAPPGYGTYYINGNYVWGSTTNTSNNWSGVTYASGVNTTTCKATTPYVTTSVATHNATDAFERVMNYGGCSFRRDTIDRRIVNEARTGTSACVGSVTGKVGLIDSPNDVGGYPVYSFTAAEVPADSDNDGMPDAWETANGLNANNASDAILYTISSTYTNIEMYINSLVSSMTSAQAVGAVTTGVTEVRGSDSFLLQNVVYNGNLKLKSHQNIAKLILYNLNGAAIYNSKPSNDVVYLSGLSNGLYIIRIVDVFGGVSSGKILVD